jgi:hypothetical protein
MLASWRSKGCMVWDDTGLVGNWGDATRCLQNLGSYDLGFGLKGSGSRVQGPWFRVRGTGCGVQGAGYWVQGTGYRGEGLGLRANRANSLSWKLQGLGIQVQPATSKRAWLVPFGSWACTASSLAGRSLRVGTVNRRDLSLWVYSCPLELAAYEKNMPRKDAQKHLVAAYSQWPPCLIPNLAFKFHRNTSM